MSLEPCEYCGKEFDHNNAGAKTQHENSCKRKAEKYQQNQPSTEATPEVQHTAPAESAPVARDTAATQHDQQMVAADSTQHAIQTGMQVGGMLSSMSAGTPEEKAETQGQLLTAAGSAIAQIGETFTRQQKEEINRAKNADQSNVGVVEDYVDCPECGQQITNLPEAGSQFRCPGCRTLLESK